MNNITPDDRRAYRNYRQRNTREQARQLMHQRAIIIAARDI